MSTLPISSSSEPLALRPFRLTDAALVASWSTDPRDALWIAPRTAPPITADSVVDWTAGATFAGVLVGAADPVAYGELNLLDAGYAHWWIGHLVVAPSERGRGVGRALIAALLDRAFTASAAKVVTLVVFRENRAAIRAYEAAGMRFDGYETHYFESYQRREVLMRMIAKR